MKRRLHQITLSLAAASTMCMTLSAQRALPSVQSEFTTTYQLADGQEVVVQGHYYRSSSGIVREGGSASVTITDLGQGTVTVLNMKEKEARIFKVAVFPERSRPASEGTESGVQVPDASHGFQSNEELVDGLRVTKSKRVSGEDDSEEVWVAKDLGLVVFRQIRKAGTVTTRRMHSIVVKEPAPAVFQIPAEFTVVHEDRHEGASRILPLPDPQRLPRQFPR